MAENLNCYVTGSLCYYNDPVNCTKYGRLYNWETAMSICPSDWHLPSNDEWDVLIDFVGGESIAGTKLKATSGWGLSNDNGTDEYGFSALPGGFGRQGGSSFDLAGNHGYWWTSTKYDAIDAYSQYIYYSKNVPPKYYTDKRYLESVRCLQDSSPANVSSSSSKPSSSSSLLPSSSSVSSSSSVTPSSSSVAIVNGTFTDNRDGRSYKWVKIGTQVWMAENLNYSVIGKRCYNDREANCNIWGSLYDWYLAKEACPWGWHLPSDAEWTKLTDFVGGSSTAGKKLRTKSSWTNDLNGTDDYGFSALPGGRGLSDGSFIRDFSDGYWWTATESVPGNTIYAYYRNMNYNDEAVYRTYDRMSNLLSIRCLQD